MTVTPPAHTDLRDITIDVRGIPHPQGSMRTHALPNGKIAVRYPPAVWDWRRQVQAAVSNHMVNDVGELTTHPIPGPVEVHMGFDLPRPANHYLPVNSKRSVPQLKLLAPLWPSHKPDLDKLTRAVLDAVTDAGLWADDAQVVSLRAAKRYVTNQPGVRIRVREMPT